MDAILYTIIGAFVAWEATAHFLLHNTRGHTLSNRVGWIERHGPLWLRILVRVLVAVCVIVLGLHLEIFP